jgi:hypothetical protein
MPLRLPALSHLRLTPRTLALSRSSSSSRAFSRRAHQQQLPPPPPPRARLFSAAALAAAASTSASMAPALSADSKAAPGAPAYQEHRIDTDRPNGNGDANTHKVVSMPDEAERRRATCQAMCAQGNLCCASRLHSCFIARLERREKDIRLRSSARAIGLRAGADVAVAAPAAGQLASSSALQRSCSPSTLLQVIIGSGPAGHTAAIYLARANLEPILFEVRRPGRSLFPLRLLMRRLRVGHACERPRTRWPADDDD